MRLVSFLNQAPLFWAFPGVIDITIPLWRRAGIVNVIHVCHTAGFTVIKIKHVSFLEISLVIVSIVELRVSYRKGCVSVL